MKTWFAQWRISSALDDGRPLSPALQRAVEQSAELRRFVAGHRAVEQALKASVPMAVAPPALHAAIMQAVRRAAPKRIAARPEWRPRLVPAAACGLLLLLLGTGYYCWHRPPVAASSPGSSSLAAASSALDAGGEIVCAMPGAALAPLTNELQSLNRDVTAAGDFLVASLP